MTERDETRDVWIQCEALRVLSATNSSTTYFLAVNNREEIGTERLVRHSDLLAAEQRAEAAEARVEELERELGQTRDILNRRMQERANVVSKADSEYADALRRIAELEPLAAAYREIGEAHERFLRACKAAEFPETMAPAQMRQERDTLLGLVEAASAYLRERGR